MNQTAVRRAYIHTSIHCLDIQIGNWFGQRGVGKIQNSAVNVTNRSQSVKSVINVVIEVIHYKILKRKKKTLLVHKNTS